MDGSMKAIQFYTRLFLVLLAALSVGLHWGAVQLVGWASMTLEYSRTVPLSDALEMTFDGKHPCKLCKLVAKEGPLSENDEKQAPGKKFELKSLVATLWPEEIPLALCSDRSSPWTGPDARARSKRDRPPLPPPRGPMSCPV
jgi:hypothetical protein